MTSTRPALPDDLQEILRLAVDTGMFEADETAPVEELVRAAVGEGEDSAAIVADGPDDGGSRLAGVAVLQAKPAADGVWDLTMLSVDPAAQGTGVGRRLIGAAEDLARERGGRLMIVETSATADFEGGPSLLRRRRVPRGGPDRRLLG